MTGWPPDPSGGPAWSSTASCWASSPSSPWWPSRPSAPASRPSSRRSTPPSTDGGPHPPGQLGDGAEGGRLRRSRVIGVAAGGGPRPAQHHQQDFAAGGGEDAGVVGPVQPVAGLVGQGRARGQAPGQPVVDLLGPQPTVELGRGRLPAGAEQGAGPGLFEEAGHVGGGGLLGAGQRGAGKAVPGQGGVEPAPSHLAQSPGA